MVLNIHRNHKAYYKDGEKGEGGMEVGEEGVDYTQVLNWGKLRGTQAQIEQSDRHRC